MNDPQPSLVAAGRRGLMRSALIAVALVLVFGAGVSADRVLWQGGAGANASSSLTDQEGFATFQETWDLVHNHYVDIAAVDDQELLYGATRGMLEAVGDTGHTRFLDPEEAREFDEQTRGEIIGVGVELDLRDGLPIVVAPIDGSPAAAAGILSGDTILEVDGQQTDNLDMGALTDLIRGDEGTEVTMTLRHAGQTETYSVTLTRQLITIDPVTWAMLPEGVAHVRISDFSEGTTDDLVNSLRAAKAAGATAIILDLRDNPGGLVNEATGVANQFLPEGKVIYQQQDRGETAEPVWTVPGGEALDLPMLVLINQGTASAAEIVAGALNDNGRADLVGDTTYGTGTVLIPFSLDDGSVALIGTSFWLTANGDQIWDEGVVPDVEVELPLDSPASRPSEDPEVTDAELQSIKDTQLQYAYAALTAS